MKQSTRRRQYVYAAYSPSKDQIKIGVSVSPKARVKSLGWRGSPVFLIAAIRGDRGLERRYHRNLRAFRCQRYSPEWFHPCPEVMLSVSEMLFMSRARRIDRRESAFDRRRMGRAS